MRQATDSPALFGRDGPDRVAGVDDTLRLPHRCLVVLVGPPAAGKSTWADENFRAGQVVGADRLRAMVGEGEHDQKAGSDAFDVLDLVVERRLKRGLLTVVDTLALNDERRRSYLETAARHGVPCYAVAFDVPARVCRERNKGRPRPVPARVLSHYLRRWEEIKKGLAAEGFAAVVAPGPVEVVPAGLLDAPGAARRQREEPVALRFGLQVSSFDWDGGAEVVRERLGEVAGAAEEAGFSSIWVMDHFRQIPQVGREWDPMLEAYTTLGYLAGVTSTARLGTLVTGLTYRNVALVGKMVATLDVLSGGRAFCGIGAGWFEKEHTAYGWEFPSLAERYALLEDALELLPLLWGPGSPAFSGRAIDVPEAMSYPRPLQERIPILVGGQGERRTLRLVARHADACNLFGDAATVRDKLAVLRDHCEAEQRDPDEIEVTHLAPALTAGDATALGSLVDRLRPPDTGPESFAASVNAAVADDQVGRFRELADAGVQHAIVTLPATPTPELLAPWAEVIAAFS